MPIQPPTRPHSANPQMSINLKKQQYQYTLFPRPSSSSSPTTTSAPVPTPFGSVRPGVTRVSSIPLPNFGREKEKDWDDGDAWDSSSDKEVDHDDTHVTSTGISEPMKISRTAPIPVSNPPTATSQEQEQVSTSWASTSYQHISPPSSNPNDTIVLVPTRAPAPAPASALALGRNDTPATNGTSKLTPGGDWELVEQSELNDLERPEKVGKAAVRDDVEDILRDPLQLLESLSLDTHAQPSLPDPNSPSIASASTFLPQAQAGSSTPAPTPAPRGAGISRQRSVHSGNKREKFAAALTGNEDGVNLAVLKNLAWSGIPSDIRPIAWQLLLNYLPLPTQPRLTTLNRKRKEYSALVEQYFEKTALDQQIWHQIEIDVPRTRPGVPLWSCEETQRSLEKILYVWAIRHPASGYVQGINDLVCPFFQVFLSAYIDTDPEQFDVKYLEPHVLKAIEADTFWCLTKLLDGIQDNYISQQPGIQRLVKRMSELVKRIDAPLAAHFEDQGVEFMQFAFRWMNCLLMREISVKCTIRMWDTYLSEGTDAFSQFHLYVCSALLVKYSDKLREMDFQEMIMFLQCLPTQNWTDNDIKLLLSEAYVLMNVWQGAENHFANLPNGIPGGQFGMLGRS